MIKKYVKVPIRILNNYQLSTGSKILFGEIFSLCNKEGYCYASNKYLADSLALSKKTISNYIRELRDEGIIEYKIIKGNIRNIFIRNIELYL